MVTGADHRYMERALALAASATRQVLPNPTVGAVIVAENSVIGEGHHEFFGGPHAEVNAINAVLKTADLPASTIYVTLEPCSHIGKTGPCVDRIIASRIPRVVVGCRDPFPQVSGRGIETLRSAGLEVIEGILHDACVLANSRFILSHRLHRPYIILKWAQTQNGLVAPLSREPVTISSELSQNLVHYWRGQEMAIAVGNATARGDNPRLTVRRSNLYRQHELPPQQPTRVVIGNAQRLPSSLALWQTDAPTLVFSPSGTPYRRTEPHISVEPYDPDSPLAMQVCNALYRKQILSIIIEGGTATLNQFIEADLWDEIRVFTSPAKFPAGLAAPGLPNNPQLTTTVGSDTLQMLVHPALSARLGVAESSISSLISSALKPL
ncbi:MAG: bifunctional diaminohydroxyphosphoribosylaminopyrimidine deaminase/5-amino-6-(5-phosphoribosylamino)uracil reductase RibD [Pseudomonadota bacterium]